VGGLFPQTARAGLFQSRRNASEGRIETRPHATDYRDDSDRNAGSNQPVFDGGGSLFVCDELLYQMVHWSVPFFLILPPPIKKIREIYIQILLQGPTIRIKRTGPAL
jgi:hypothetical protein